MIRAKPTQRPTTRTRSYPTVDELVLDDLRGSMDYAIDSVLFPSMLIAVSLAAPAPSASVQLQEATACMGLGDFPCAENALKKARSLLAGAPPRVRLDILALSAELAFKLDRPDEARRHLKSVVAIDPGFDPGKSWAEPWLKVLQEVRAAMPDIAAPDVQVSTPLAARAGDPVEIRARITDRSDVREAFLIVGDVRIPMTRAQGNEWIGRVPGERVRAPFLVVAIEAKDVAGNGPGRAQVKVQVVEGTAGSAAEAEPEFYETWWFWTIIGGAVVGTAVGLGVGLSGGDSPKRNVVWRF